MRASSLFPILSVGLLFIGGVCVAASEFYKARHNIILSAGIFFVSSGDLRGSEPSSVSTPFHYVLVFQNLLSHLHRGRLADAFILSDLQ